MSAVMTVTILSPDLFGNSTAKADSADSDDVLEISASDYSNVDDIKAAVLKGLIGDTANVEDYDFYYDFTFDALSVGDFSPKIMLDDEEIAKLYGSDSAITTYVTGYTQQAYDLLQSSLVSYVENNSQVSLLADYYGTTNKDIANSIFPEGAEGKQRLAEILEGTYRTTFDGYDEDNPDPDALAYITFTVEGNKGSKTFEHLLGITLPAIGAGEWDVTLVNKTTNKETPGTVSIAKQNAKLTVSGDVKDGIVKYTGEGINVFDTAADTVQVYVGLENCANSSIDTLGSNADKVFVSLILPDGIDRYQFRYDSTDSELPTISEEQKQKIEDMLTDTEISDDEVKEWLGSAEIEKEHIDTIIETINKEPEKVVDVVTDMIVNGDVTKEQLEDAYKAYQEAQNKKNNSTDSSTDGSDSSDTDNGTSSGILSDDEIAIINSLLKSQGSDKTVDDLTDEEIAAYLEKAQESGMIASLEDTAAAEEDDSDDDTEEPALTEVSNGTEITVSGTLASQFGGQSIEDICAGIDKQYPGMGDTIVKYINSYVSNGITDVELKINEYPSEVGTYYAAAFTFDSNYVNAYETTLYCIADESTDVHTLSFVNEAVSIDGVNTLYRSQELGTKSDAGTTVVSYYIAKDLKGRGNISENISNALTVAIAKTSNETAKSKLNSIKDMLETSKTPGAAAKAYAALLKYYNIAADDDEGIAFLNEIATELVKGGYDLSNYGIYTNEADVKANRCGEYLQISIEVSDEGYVSVPVYRVFTLVNDQIETPVVKNIKSTKATTNVVYWEAVDDATGYVVYRKLNDSTSEFEAIATVDGGDVESYTDKTAKAGTSYVYSVQAVSGKFTSEISDGMATLDIPTLVNAGYETVKNKNLTITWSQVDSATGYYVYKKENKSGAKWTRIATIEGGDITSYTYEETATETEFIYTVRAARANAGIDGYSFYDTNGIKNLAVPELVNAGYSNVKNQTVTVTWKAVEGATGYIVYKKVNKAGAKWTRVDTIEDGDETSYTYAEEATTKQFIYTVRAVRENDDTTVYSYFDVDGLTTLEKPELVNAGYNSVKNKKFTITWTKVEGATGYLVYKKANTATAKWVRIAEVNDGNKTSYTYTEDNTSKQYVYTVRAVRTSGSTTVYSYFDLGIKSLTNPKLVNAGYSNAKNKNVTVTWNKVEGATGYLVYKKANTATAKWVRVAEISGGSKTSYTYTESNTSKQYVYTVRAIRKSGSTTVYSYFNSEVTSLANPKLVNAGYNNVKNKKVTVTWSTVSGATGYIVYKKVNKDGAKWARVATVNGGSKTSYTYTENNTSTQYIYTVRAVRKSGSATVYSYFNAGIKSLALPTVSNITTSKKGNVINWNKVSSATGYIVYRRVNKTGSKWARIAVVNSGNTIKYTDTTAKSGTKYVYTIRAIRKISGKTVYSFFKSGKSIKTK
jgi:hypothetical protein